MRGVRIREVLLLVALVALGLGWWRDRTLLAARLGEAERTAATLGARLAERPRELEQMIPNCLDH